MNPRIVHLLETDIEALRSRLENLPQVFSFKSHAKLAARIASYGIFREIGTPNDELARFIFNADSHEPVSRESLKAEFIEWNSLFGVRIYSTSSERLELRTPGFYDVVHPALSTNADGTLHALFIFPEIIEQIAAQEGVELVLVKSWGLNSIFGGFDPSKDYYQTNFWELENNDVVQFADLTRQGQIAFMGTHDLIAHIAGVDRNHWIGLKRNAQGVYDAINRYFLNTKKPSISSLILPYTIGVVLDDLAQPPSYSSQSHLAVLDELLVQIENRSIAPDLQTVLLRFPESFQMIIELSRAPAADTDHEKIKTTVETMTHEILSASLRAIA